MTETLGIFPLRIADCGLRNEDQTHKDYENSAFRIPNSPLRLGGSPRSLLEPVDPPP
jgi:hypothetical protein